MIGMSHDAQIHNVALESVTIMIDVSTKYKSQYRTTLESVIIKMVWY